MVEKAVHITNLKNLKYFQKDKYHRLYWGTEFCQNLIPSLTDTEKILRFVEKNNLKFSFITPFVTEQGLRKLKEIFSWLKKEGVDCEIVINDWGVLEYLQNGFSKYFELVLGRLLARQQRDPVMKRVLEKQLPFAMRGKDGKIRILVHKVPDKQYQEGIRQSYVNSPLVQDLLAKFGVKRVELNNLLQGLNLGGIKFKKSLYTPFVNISTSRFCPMGTRFQKIYRMNVCRRECQKYYEILRNRAVPKIIYKRGNTTFYKNPIKTRILANLLTQIDANQMRINANLLTPINANLMRMGANVDRIVFQPELPF
jgi:hypothetical protein